MLHLSIKARVTAWFAIVMFVIASAVFYVMIVHRSSQIKNDAERNLVNSVNGFTDMVKRTDGTLPSDSPLVRPDENAADGTIPPQRGDLPAAPDNERARGGDRPKTYAGGVHMAVYDEELNLLLGQIPFEFDELQFEDNTVRTVSSNSERFLMLDQKVTLSDGRTVWVKGVTNISGALDAVNSTIASDFALITALIVIAAIGGYFIVGKALAPISKMRKTAQEIADSNDLSKRLSLGDGKDEVYRLGAVFDEMLDKIEASFEAEKQFTSDASHELRTPVSVILSECEYAMDCAKTEEEYQDSLAVIKRQGGKMSKLISELLTISRMDKHNLIPEFEEVNLSELLEIVCEEQREISEGNIALDLDIEENVCAKADSSLIARLFVNLIQNAFQYGRDGGYVQVSLKSENGNILFSVTDNGIGIKKEELPKIWERFYQVNQSRTNPNGSMGLGLAMVKQIAQIHKGRMEVKSELGEGSTFTFIMPSGL